MGKSLYRERHNRSLTPGLTVYFHSTRPLRLGNVKLSTDSSVDSVSPVTNKETNQDWWPYISLYI